MKIHSLKYILLVCLAVTTICACGAVPTDEPPGVGEKADRGYAACAPIIEALEKYLSDKGTYPETLEELIPDYIDTIPAEVNENPIAYQKAEDGYSLSFYYIGPGMNWCNYTPEDGWNCSGAY